MRRDRGVRRVTMLDAAGPAEVLCHETLRRVFARHLGVTPTEYGRRFRDTVAHPVPHIVR